METLRSQIGTATAGSLRMLEMVIEAERYIKFSVYGGGISGLVDKARLEMMYEATSALNIAGDVADTVCHPVPVEVVEEAGSRAIEVSVLVDDLIKAGEIPPLLAEPLLFALKNVERAVALSLGIGCLIGLSESLKTVIGESEAIFVHAVSTGVASGTWSRVAELLVVIDGVLAALMLAGFASSQLAALPTVATGVALALDKSSVGASVETYAGRLFERLTGQSSRNMAELPEASD